MGNGTPTDLHGGAGYVCPRVEGDRNRIDYDNSKFDGSMDEQPATGLESNSVLNNNKKLSSQMFLLGSHGPIFRKRLTGLNREP
jgi:hypothetical protein